jgi:hypothetical protein
MPQLSQNQPDDSNPTAAEIFRVFRNTTVASIQGLRLLLGECADLRADLVTLHRLHSGGDGDGVFSARQQNRILELQDAANEMGALLTSLPCEAGTRRGTRWPS